MVTGLTIWRHKYCNNSAKPQLSRDLIITGFLTSMQVILIHILILFSINQQKVVNLSWVPDFLMRPLWAATVSLYHP